MTNLPERHEGYLPTEHGLKLFYRRFGDGPEVVVAPSGCWLEADFEPLINAQRTWIFFDTRGSGASDTVTDATQVQAGYELRDLDAVRRHLRIKQMALLGWSMFGTVVARYAAEHPDQITRLVMMCPAYIRSEAPYLDMDAIRQKASGRIDPNGIERLEALKQQDYHMAQPEAYSKEHQRVYLVRQMGRPEVLGNMKSNPCRYENEWPRNLISFVQRLSPSKEYDWRAVAASIQAPTLVIHGSEDLIPVQSSAEWAATIPGAKLEVIQGSGHYPHLEEPDQFFAAANSFLNI
ncbi:MAG: alpha/beta hydrolase [Chloroflexota bacterium]|nr:alpha/beta hydrolase [Chloroflexota bacterium]